MGLLCDLQLDNVAGNYQAGDVISGRIALTLQERVLMKALALKISGYAGVGWVKPLKEKKQKPKKSKDNDDQYITAQETKQIVENYINREDYISTINYFIGSEAATPKLIDSGSFLYNFSVRLPEHCPATFDSQIGHIRYELDVFIDFPDRRHTCMQRAVTVQRPIDLRLEPTLMQPAEVDLMEHVKFGKFWQRPLQLHADITQSGYVPGEVASVHVKIENAEALKLTEIVYKLNQVGHYTGVFKKKLRVKTDTRCLQTHVHSLHGQSMTTLQHLQSITIPYATPGTLDATSCKCIQLLYEIEVLVQTVKRKRLLRAVLPIKIGTISLKSNLRVLPPELGMSVSTLSAARSMDNLSSSSTLDAMQANGYVATAPTPDSPSLAASMTNLASSFREADFMIGANLNKNKKHAMSGDKLDFKPKYLVYDMESTNNPAINTETMQTAQPSQILEEPERIYPTAPQLDSPEEPVNHWTTEKAPLP